MTLERVTQLYSQREIWEAETYWQIEHMIHSSNSGSASGSTEADLEAAFQKMRQNAQPRDAVEEE